MKQKTVEQCELEQVLLLGSIMNHNCFVWSDDKTGRGSQVFIAIDVVRVGHSHYPLLVPISILLGECSAFLASGSDPTDDRRRHKV